MRLLSSVLALLLLLGVVCAAGSFSIPHADLTYYLLENGSVLVHENITYSLNGDFHELYLQKPMDLPILNARGHCEPVECQFREQDNKGWHELVLASDFHPGTVNAVFDYQIDHQLLDQKDTAQFFYKLWGDQWSVGVGRLDIAVALPPNGADYEFFLHPPTEHFDVVNPQNVIHLSTLGHPKKTYVEMNLLFSKDGYTLYPAENYMSKAQIMEGERKYIQDEKDRQMLLPLILLGPWFLAALAFVLIYWFMGREIPLKELHYEALYEREPPDRLSPAQAGYFITKHSAPELISAEILLLEHRGYIELSVRKEKGLIGTHDEAYVRILKGPDDKLLAHQRILLNHLARSRSGTAQVLADASKSAALSFPLSSLAYATDAPKFYSDFFSPLQTRLFKRDLILTGNQLMKGLMAALAAIAFLSIFIVGPPSHLSFLASLFSVLSFCVGAALLHVFPQVLGRWTPEGRVLEQKCLNFKKFLNDFGSFKDKEVAQLKLWDEYLIYATAFGIADKVLQTLKQTDPKAYASRSAHYDHLMISIACVNVAVHSISSAHASGSSAGGFGGGFGGGGGGGGAR